MILITQHEDGIGVQVGDHLVDVSVQEDGDGAPFIQIAGVDCDLTGMEPGVYYVAPLGTVAGPGESGHA